MTYEKVEISELVSMRGGGTPKTDVDEYWGGNVQWLTPTEISDGESVYVKSTERNPTKEGINNSSAKILPEGTVLMTSRATVGVPVINREKMATNQGFISMKTNDRLYNLYLFYWIKNNRERIKRRATGSTYDEISQTQMKKIEIQLPPINVQKKVADFLYNIDRKIEVNRELAGLLEETAHAIYESWFEAYEPYDIPDEQDHPEEFKQVRLSSEIDIKKGYSYSSEELSDEVTEYPMLNLGTVEPNGGYNKDNLKYLEGEPENYEVEYKDIILAHTDMTQDREILGSPLIVPDLGDAEKIVYSLDLSLVSGTNLPVEFLYFYFLSDKFKRTVEESASGTTVLRFSEDVFETINLQKPSSDSLREYTDIVSPLLEKREHLRRDTEDLIELRDYLLPQLLSGEVVIQDEQDDESEEDEVESN